MATKFDDTRERELAVEGRGLQEEANQFLENGQNEGRNTLRGPRQKTTYDKRKTITEGLLDFGLLFANISQLKNVIDVGPSHAYYILLLVLFIGSILTQIALACLIVIQGSGGDNEIDPQSVQINNAVVISTVILTILDITASSFAMSASKDPKLN